MATDSWSSFSTVSVMISGALHLNQTYLESGIWQCNENISTLLYRGDCNRGYNSPGCCYCRKVLLLLYMWISGFKPLSPNSVWFTASYLLLPLSLWTIWFHLGSQPFFQEHFVNTMRRGDIPPSQSTQNYVSCHKEKKVKTYFIWLAFLISSRCRDSLWCRWKEVPVFQMQHMFVITDLSPMKSAHKKDVMHCV